MPLGVLLAAGAATKGAEALAVLAAGATAYKLRKPTPPSSEPNTTDKDREEKSEDREDDTAGLWEFEEEDIQGWLPGAHLRVDGDRDEAPVYSTRSNLDDYQARFSSGLPDPSTFEKESNLSVPSHKQAMTGSGWTAFIWNQKARTDNQLGGDDS